MAGLSLLRVASNADLMKREQEELVRAELVARQTQPVILSLAGYIKRCWDAARSAKQPIETQMLASLRRRNGEYDPVKLNAIRQQGGSEVFMMITDVKCRAAESWLRDILLDTGMPPWDIQPTPLPELKPEDMTAIYDKLGQAVMQYIQSTGASPDPVEVLELQNMFAQDYRNSLLREAQAKCDGMKAKISDQFVQGGWAEAFNDMITDVVTFPAAFIKGPIVRRQRTLGWAPQLDGSVMAVPDEVLAPEYERVDPFLVYPEPGITNINDGYFIEVHKMPRTELAELIGVPGYDDDAIRHVLDGLGGIDWLTTTDIPERDVLERKYSTEMRPTDIYDAIEFWGKVSGKMLLEWGMSEEEIDDPAKEYDANVWLIGDTVIKAVLNYDPLGEKPYTKVCFIKVPGAFWGKGIPEIIADVQDVANAAARALVNNMGIASGPQVEVNLSRISANEDITQMVPWKIWQVNADPLSANDSPAIRFTQPVDNSDGLLKVYEKFSRLADEHSGIPAYLYGDLDVQGAGRTSSGLSMLMGAAGKGIRQVVGYIDSDVIKPVVQRQFTYNMRYIDDPFIKGDAQIVPRGAINLAVKESTLVRKLEFLQATANPIDLEIVGKSGRTAILREVAKGLQMPIDDVIPSYEKEQFMARVQPPSQSGQGESQSPIGAALSAGGEPKGGQSGNTVSNRNTGAA